jgi:hypothetical protein
MAHPPIEQNDRRKKSTLRGGLPLSTWCYEHRAASIPPMVPGVNLFLDTTLDTAESSHSLIPASLRTLARTFPDVNIGLSVNHAC